MSVCLAPPPARGRVTMEAPLAPLTWFKTGGPADILFEPADVAGPALELALWQPPQARRVSARSVTTVSRDVSLSYSQRCHVQILRYDDYVLEARMLSAEPARCLGGSRKAGALTPAGSTCSCRLPRLGNSTADPPCSRPTTTVTPAAFVCTVPHTLFARPRLIAEYWYSADPGLLPHKHPG